MATGEAHLGLSKICFNASSAGLIFKLHSELCVYALEIGGVEPCGGSGERATGIVIL